MKNLYDVIVVGLGIMGAAALWRVAPKCSRVLGIEASGPTHCYGSSQGSSRIFRRAYWEGEKYLQLLHHSDLLWNELERGIQKHLLFRTGGIFIGPQSSRVVAGSIETARLGSIEHELWTLSKIRNCLPAFNVLDGMHAVYEPGAYAISACNARLEMLNEAVRHSAITEFGDHVVNLENHRFGIRVTTKSGRTYLTKSAIVTAGPWITATHFIPEIAGCLETRKVPIYWFKPKIGFDKLFSQENFPIFLYECEDGGLLYGVPSIVNDELGVKIGFHNKQQTPASPEWMNAPVQQSYITEISKLVESTFPKLEHLPTKAKNCFYTMSRDESFLIGKSKTLKSTYFASACSGHGFKFAPAIGDALANMAVGQQTCFSLSTFSADRFNIT